MSGKSSQPVQSITLVGGQILVATMMIAGLAFAPPARGRMLLLPLTDRAGGEVARVALNHGATLLGRGPVRESLVIQGDSAALAGPLLTVGVIAIAAPAIICGDGFRGGGTS